jgi:hypothetical protein
MEIDFRVVLIECHKTNDTTEDTVYLAIKGEFVGSKANFDLRVPVDGSTWTLAKAQSVGPNAELFNGPIEKGLNISVQLKEQDFRGLVGSFDDTIGEIQLALQPECPPEWSTGKHTEYQGYQPDGSHLFELSGANANYSMRLKLFQKLVL